MIEPETIIAAQKRWHTAVAEGGAIAEQAAHEALHRCADAVAILVENLKSIGYPWAMLIPAPLQSLEKNVLTIEQTIGQPLPPVLVLFWQVVGGVSLVDLDHYKHVEFWDQHEITTPHNFCDGLHVDACTPNWADFVCRDYQDWKDYGGSAEGGQDPFLISLAPDGYHKDNISGGAPYGVYPGSSWAPVWENFEWTGLIRPVGAPPGAPDFLSYLRTTILECAGFPGCLGASSFMPLRDRLLEGVSPF